MVLDWYEITFTALRDLWIGFLDFIPALIGALIVFVIGWFVALAIGRLISEILIRIKFNELFERTDWKQALSKAKLNVNPAEFLGAIVKWILVIVFLMAAVEILELPGFAAFLAKVVNYLPNVFVAALIFVVAVIVADILEKIVVAAVEKMRISYSQLVGTVVKWSIWIFAILAILYQLGVVPQMIQTLFGGLVALVVISFGLAFGLGGKDVAAEFLQEWKRKLKGE
ncbi:MAG: hypothetical protein WBC21_00260 [Minisyncoccales bacterium]